MPQKRLLMAVAVLFAFASVSRATITSQLVLSPNQPSAGAIQDAQTFDSVDLSQYKTYDLNVTLSGSGQETVGGPQVGDTFTTAGLIFHLNSGSFYRADNRTSPHGPSNFSRWNTAGFREYQYDTFLAHPPNFDSNTNGDPLILNKRFYPPDQQDQAAIWISNEINVIWGGQNSTTTRNPLNGTVTYTIARFTISNNANGYLYGQVNSEFDGPVTVSTAGTTFAPEPATMSLLGLAAGFMLRRPKRRIAGI
jgi:hypothetical protein